MTPIDDGGAPVRGAWPLVWWLSAAQLCSWGTLYYAVAVLMAPMEAELGWSRADILLGVTIGLLVCGLATPAVGAWLDRRGGLTPMTGGSLLGGVMLIIWAGVGDLLAYHVICVGIGLAQAMTLYEPAFAVVTANLGRDYRRGITTMTLLGGLAGTVFIPATQLLVDSIGWRQGLIVLGLVNLVICAGIHFAVLRGARVAAQRSRGAQGELSRAVRRALAMPVFWLLCLAFTAYTGVFFGLTFHLIPVMTDAGLSTAWAVVVFSVIGPMQVAGRLITLGIAGSVGPVPIGRLAMAGLPVSLLILWAFPDRLPALFAFALLYGFCNGFMTIVRGTSVPEMIGREAYGTLNGLISAPPMLARALAPAGIGALWLAFGGYGPVLWLLVLIAGGGAAAFWLAAARAKV